MVVLVHSCKAGCRVSRLVGIHGLGVVVIETQAAAAAVVVLACGGHPLSRANL